MPTPDVLTVTLNPTLDVSTSVPKLIDHIKLRCSSEHEQVGGGGINVANVIASLGGNCQAMLPVGGLRGQQILSHLQANGIDCISTAIEQANRQCFTVYETDTGHEFRFVPPGPTLSGAEQEACIEVILQNLPRRFLVLSGSLPGGLADDFYARVITRVRQSLPRLPIVVDTSGAALAHALKAGVFAFKPSREEFAELTGQTPEQPGDCIEACRKWIADGSTELVAVTLGAQGAVLVSATGAWHAEPLPVTVTSTVGAGDGFVGGLVWSLLRSHDLPRATRIGTAAAAQALQTQGELRFKADQVLANSAQVVLNALV